MTEGFGISGVRAPAATHASARRTRTEGQFAVGVREDAAAPALGGIEAVALGGMLAMQEAEADAAGDREARRHGNDMLLELSGLQRDLLGDGPSEAGLSRLAALAARAAYVGNKGLRGVLDAIGLRARVELARYQIDAERSHIAPPRRAAHDPAAMSPWRD